MSIERFIKGRDGSNFITIEAGVNAYDLEQMSGDAREHHLSIRFLDSAGDVFPTSGIVEFQSSQFRNPVYDSIEGGKFNAADLALDYLERPVIYGPARAVRVILSNIEGLAVSAVVKVTSF